MRRPSISTSFAVDQGHNIYDELHEAQRGRIARLCRLMVSDLDVAEEVCQDTFLKLHVALGSETREMDWPRWLTRVAANGCRDVLRAQWWKRRSRRGEEFVEDEHGSPEPGPEQQLLGRRQRLRIHAAMEGLSARQRQVFVLRHFEGWSTQEVADELGLSTGSIKRHLFRAVAALRDALGESR